MNERKTPKWETAVMVLSFVALWAWWLARQANARLEGGLPEHPLPIAWNGLLLVSFVMLVVVMVRRMARVKRSLRENWDAAPTPYGNRGHGGPPHGGRVNGAPKQK